MPKKTPEEDFQYCYEYRNGKIAVFHKFTFHYSDPSCNWYRTAGSVSAFRRWNSKRVDSTNSEKFMHLYKTLRWFYLIDQRAHEVNIEFNLIPNVEIVIHKNVWEFYTYIGYDYKAKKLKDAS